MKWKLVFTKQAQKDAKKLAASGLRTKAETLLVVAGNAPAQLLYDCLATAPSKNDIIR